MIGVQEWQNGDLRGAVMHPKKPETPAFIVPVDLGTTGTTAVNLGFNRYKQPYKWPYKQGL